MAEYIALALIIGGAAAYLAVALRKKMRSLKEPCSTGCGGCHGCPLGGASRDGQETRQ